VEVGDCGLGDVPGGDPRRVGSPYLFAVFEPAGAAELNPDAFRMVAAERIPGPRGGPGDWAGHRSAVTVRATAFAIASAFAGLLVSILNAAEP
jgi:hypothetical protein